MNYFLRVSIIMAHSCVEIYVHLIFSTKRRRPLISNDMEKRLYGYLSGIAKKRNIPILSINGTNDHIHILIKLNASTPISILIKELKSYSTGWLKKQGVLNFEWQEGYGAFSCSITHLKKLVKYIENQKEHHKVESFEQVLTQSLSFRGGSSELFVSYIYFFSFFSFILFSIMLPIRCFS